MTDDGQFERTFQVVILSDVGIIPTDSPGVPATNNPYDTSVFNVDSAAFTIAINGLDYIMGLDAEETVFLELVHTPTLDIQDGLRIMSVLLPTREAMLIPNIVAEYEYYIAAGVKAKFLRMHSRPWSDVNGGFEEDRIYQEGVNKFRSRLNQNLTSQDIFVAYPPGY